MYNNDITLHCFLDISGSLNVIVLKKYLFFTCLSVPENQQGADFRSTVSSISCPIPKRCSVATLVIHILLLQWFTHWLGVMFRNSEAMPNFIFHFSEPFPFYFQLCMLSCILYTVGLCMQVLTKVNNKPRNALKITLVSKFNVSALLYSYSRIKETMDTIFQKTVGASK